MRVRCALGFALILATGALAGCAPSHGTSALPSTSPGEHAPGAEPPRTLSQAPHQSGRPPLTAEQARRLTRRLDRYLSHRPGRAGLAVYDLSTGVSFGYHARSRFTTASVAKVEILTALLLARQQQGRKLTKPERLLATRMIQYSDNAAAFRLYRTIGYGPGMTRAGRRLGLRCTIPANTVWGATRSCPADQVRLLRALSSQRTALTTRNRQYVLSLMRSVTPGQAWGVSAGARHDETVALKNGWTPLRYSGHGWAVNSIGVIRGPRHHFLIAVFTAGSPTMTAGVRTGERLTKLTLSALRDASLSHSVSGNPRPARVAAS